MINLLNLINNDIIVFNRINNCFTHTKPKSIIITYQFIYNLVDIFK